MSQLKPLLELVDAAVSLFLKLRDAKRAAPCDHDIYLAHDVTAKVEHKNEAYCACSPNYQCLKCHQVFRPGAGSFRRVTR